MQRISNKKLRTIFSNFSHCRVLVLGDIMLDEYIWGSVSRISPEAPVPVVQIVSESVRLGGAANVANNIKALGATSILVGVIGNDRDGQRLKTELKNHGIPTDGIVIDQSRATTVKTRIIAHSQQVVRTDRENTHEISNKVEQKIYQLLKQLIPRVDGVIVSDYGKGCVTQNLMKNLITLTKSKNKFIAVDPKELHWMSYHGASLITPNHHEAGAAVGKRIVDEKSLQEVGLQLIEQLDLNAVLITRGELGMTLFEKDRIITHFPTKALEVYDVTGAGDTVVSTCVVAHLSGASLKEAAFISNHAAGITVSEIGTVAVSAAELETNIQSQGRTLKPKSNIPFQKKKMI